MIQADIDTIVQHAIDAIAFTSRQIQQRAAEVMSEYSLPHTAMRPALSIDGNMWCALYGSNLQDGVAGFGRSPAEACADFDCNWYKKLSASPPSGKEGRKP